MEVETQKGVSGVRGAHLGRRGFIIPPVVPVLYWPGFTVLENFPDPVGG